MAQEIEARLDRVEALLHAHTQLLLSHICGSDALVAGVAAETIAHLDVQRDAAIKQGHIRAAVHMGDYIDQLRFVCGVPAND